MQRCILDRRERRLTVAAIIFREPAERGLAVIDERQRHRRSEIGADLRCRGGHRLQIGDVGAQAIDGRRVGPRDIHGWTQSPHVEGRVGVRLIGGFQPEQIAARHRHQIVALEALLLVEARKALRLLNGGLQRRDAPRDAGLAPIRELAVEFVATLVGREGGVVGKRTLDEAIPELVPGRPARRAARQGQRDRRRRRKHPHHRTLPVLAALMPRCDAVAPAPSDHRAPGCGGGRSYAQRTSTNRSPARKRASMIDHIGSSTANNF